MAKRMPTKEEKQKKWDTITATLNNLKSWSWDVIPQMKIEKEEAEIIIEALEHLRINILLPTMKSVRINVPEKDLEKLKEKMMEGPFHIMPEGKDEQRII